jgi:hypothetical protein
MTERRRPGRPALDPAARARIIAIRMTPQHRVAIQEMAGERRVSASTVIREAVNSYVKDYGGPLIFPAPRRTRPR